MDQTREQLQARLERVSARIAELQQELLGVPGGVGVVAEFNAAAIFHLSAERSALERQLREATRNGR